MSDAGDPAADPNAKAPAPGGRSKLTLLFGRAKGLQKKRFVRETLVLQIGMVVQMATYLFTSVVIARGLGPFDFGRYRLAREFYTILFFVANLGLVTATVSEYATACGGRDMRAKTLALARFLKVFVLMCAAILTMGIALPQVAAWTQGDSSIGWYAWAFCLLGPVELMNGFMMVMLQGSRRMSDYVMFDNACGVVRLVILIFALLMFAGLEGIVTAYLVSGVLYSVMALMLYRAVRRESAPEDAPPPLGAILRAIPSVQISTLFKSGTLLAISKNGGQLLRSFGQLMTGSKAGSESVGAFGVAYTFIWSLQQLLNGLNRSLLPAIGFRIGGAKGDPRRFERDLKRVSLVSGALFIAITAVACLVAPWLIGILYGPQYSASPQYVYLLAIGHLVIGFAVIIDPFYIYTHQIARTAKLNLLLYVFVMLPMGWLLIEKWGAAGCAIFISASQGLMIVHLAYVWWWFARRRAAGGDPKPGDPTSTAPGDGATS